MASANVTLPGSSTYGFECDNTERTATLNGRGGYVFNTDDTVTAYLNVDGGTVATSDPVGAAGLPVPPGKSVPLPYTCASFTFKSASSVFLQYTPN